MTDVSATRRALRSGLDNRNEDDQRISIDEFKSMAFQLEAWGVDLSEGADKVFKRIDQSGNGYLEWPEFRDWALAKRLDLEDDDD